MKFLRILPFLLALVLLSGCTGFGYADCLEKTEAGGYQLRLPQSGKVLEITSEEEPCLPYVTDALVAQAEQKIVEQVVQQEGKAVYWITLDDDGWLYLSAEQIVKLPVDPEAESKSGCGIDHDHLQFRERISTKPR